MKRILIVDDDPEIVGSLSMLLAEKYEVGLASDGEAALKRMKSGDFDLILLDLLMPGLDGAGFLRELAAKSDQSPVILMSAARDLADRARELKIAHYIAKPFHIDALEAQIDRLVGPTPRQVRP